MLFKKKIVFTGLIVVVILSILNTFFSQERSACNSTTFFMLNKPVLWYCKTGNHLNLFNGPGFNPENEKPLKPITQYMNYKYIINCKFPFY
jgi:hypothetical protein